MSKPFVMITLDKEYEVRMNNRASIYFEEVSNGASFVESYEKLGELSSTTLNKMLYAGIKACDKNVSLDQVIDLLDENEVEFKDLLNTVMEAIRESNFFKIASSKEKATKKLKK